MNLEQARLCHVMPGRMRLQIPDRRHDTAFFAGIEQALSRCDGVYAVRANPLTAAVLVLHAGTVDAISDYARAQGLFALDPAARVLPYGSGDRVRAVPRHRPAPSPGEQSDRRAGMLSASMAGLGALQGLRGRVMPPAMTLFWYAYDAWRTRALSRLIPPSR